MQVTCLTCVTAVNKHRRKGALSWGILWMKQQQTNEAGTLAQQRSIHKQTCRPSSPNFTQTFLPFQTVFQVTHLKFIVSKVKEAIYGLH